MSKKTTVVPYRRKREGKTDYKKRLLLLKSGRPRLVIRKSIDNILAQIIQYHEDGDRILVSVQSRELTKKGWKLSRSSIPAAYLCGYLLGKKALAKKISHVVTDIGMQRSTPGSRIYAVTKGMIDAGFKINVGEKQMPAEDRITGQHIAAYAKALKGEKEAYQKQFGGYVKEGIDPETIPKIVEDMKKKLTE